MKAIRICVASAFLALGLSTSCLASGTLDLLRVTCPSSPSTGGHVTMSWSVTSGEPDIVVVGVRSFDPNPSPMYIYASGRSGAADRRVFTRYETTDKTSKFQVTGVAPGRYKIAALRDLEDGMVQSPNLAKVVDTKGADIEVKQGANQTMDLAPISGDVSRRSALR